MSLQALMTGAVSKLQKALGDLAIDATLRRRTQNAYVPGQSVSYSNSDTVVKGVITKFRHDEVDGTLVQAKDVLIVLFPPENGVIPQPNDVVIYGGSEVRVIANNPMYAGSVIAFHLIQGRPPV